MKSLIVFIKKYTFRHLPLPCFLASVLFFILAFDVDLPYLILMSAVTSVYFLASSLPTFQFFLTLQ
jgi:hypothetical protein